MARVIERGGGRRNVLDRGRANVTFRLTSRDHPTYPPERLERPRSEHDRLADEQTTASLRWADATTFAKAAAKKSWGKQSTSRL